MKILIEDLEFYTIIGLLESERENPQKVIMQIEIDYVYKKNKFIDYASLVKFVKKFIQKEKFELIEDALITLSENLKNIYPSISEIKLSLKKPQILQNCTVGIEFQKKF